MVLRLFVALLLSPHSVRKNCPNGDTSMKIAASSIRIAQLTKVRPCALCCHLFGYIDLDVRIVGPTGNDNDDVDAVQ